MPFQIQPQVLKFPSTGAESATTNIPTEAVRLWGGRNSFQVTVVGTGSVGVTATIQVSNNGVNWIDATALTLTGTTSDSDGATIDAAWVYARVSLASISGTGATVTVVMGGGAA